MGIYTLVYIYVCVSYRGIYRGTLEKRLKNAPFAPCFLGCLIKIIIYLMKCRGHFGGFLGAFNHRVNYLCIRV